MGALRGPRPRPAALPRDHALCAFASGVVHVSEGNLLPEPAGSGDPGRHRTVCPGFLRAHLR